MIKFLKICILIFLPIAVSAQLYGTVKDDAGEELSFASIYIEGTSTGTTTNLDGFYEFMLENGRHTIVFQYVGYKKEIRTVDIDSDKKLLSVTLTPETYLMNEIVIRADAEDPAYEIMRKAIAKRDYYKNLIKEYSCDVYIKGNQKILDAPEKVLGQEIGDLDGALDSTRQGIVYLSESLSKYHFKAPNDYKEVMISSKVSGDDNGYSFNSAHEMNMNIYEETSNLGAGRNLVSPLADNSFSYYDFKLEGASIDSDGHLINKIKVIRKRKNDPSGLGYIYIVEDLWNVHSLDFVILPSASQIYFMDSLRLEQVFVPMVEPDKWVSFSSKATFKLSIFGFELYGYFVGVFKDYDLEPNFPKGFFNNELLKVEREANKKDSLYWEKVRPIPLTGEETVDYVRKDSIYEVRNSKVYLDSVDRENNKFKIGNIIGGYSYRKSSKELRLEFDSPLSHIGFNSVQGLNIDFKFRAFKYLNEEKTKYLLFNPKISYGFSEKKVRSDFIFNYRFNRTSHTILGIRGGSDITQFQESPEAIPKSWNGLYSLFFKENYAKYYDRKRVTTYVSSEIKNGIYVRTGFDFSRRSALLNNTEYSFFNKSKNYLPNTAFLDQEVETEVLDATLVYLTLRLRPGQKYLSYPDRRIRMDSNYPEFWIYYRQGIPQVGGEVRFSHLSAAIKHSVTFGTKGKFNYYINGGLFVNKGEMSFIDYKHFNGNQIDVSNPSNYTTSFLQLPYYSYSTNNRYVQAHVEHHFDGFLLDRIPGLSDLGWQLVMGAKYLKTEGNSIYSEYHIGIDNIGYKFFRLFRVDFVMSNIKDPEFNNKFGVILGIKI